VWRGGCEWSAERQGQELRATDVAAPRSLCTTASAACSNWGASSPESSGSWDRLPHWRHEREPPDVILHDEDGHCGRFRIDRDGKHAAVLTYSRGRPDLIIIDHTEVDPAYGGQGLGQALLAELVRWAREAGTKVMATCPFASAQFAKRPELADVLLLGR
jgi:predicted GNAT family acetyltransferase